MKPNSILSAAILLTFSSFVCLSASAQTAEASADNSKLSMQLMSKQKGADIKLTGVRTAFASGDQIGKLQSGAACASSAPSEWNELIQQRVEAELAAAFRDEIAKAKQSSSVLAQLPNEAQVDAFVNDLDVNICNIGKGEWSGSINVQVGWQVKANPQGRMLYQASTMGSFTRVQTQTKLSTAAALRVALAASVQNLLADKRFASAMQATNDQVATAVQY